EDPHGTQRGGRGKILVADDERTVLDLTRALLEIEGWEVATVGDGDRVIQAVEASGPYACLLLDQRLPTMAADQVLTALQPLPAPPPVVLMHGVGDPVWQTDHPLVVAVVSKPFQTDELVTAVERATRSGPLQPTAPSKTIASSKTIADSTKEKNDV
ncbi:MAG: response regulator, partial [Planctomycetota bacterium]